MPTRRFGRTGLDMPVLSCGGMRFQHSWKDLPLSEVPAESQENLAALVRQSASVGMRHLETARGYGTSEVQLGEILESYPREQWILQTKVGPREDGEEFKKVVATSLSNLRVDHVDLLALHGINNAELLDLSLKRGGSLEAALELKKDGICRHVGFSTHAPLEVILRAIDTGAFDYINLHWYYVMQANRPAIDAAKKHDMGVFIISPTDKGGRLFEPPPKLVELCRPLSPIAFNDLFCLACPDVHTLSLGAAKASDLDEHVEAMKRLPEAAALTGPIASRLDAEQERALGADWVAHGLDGVSPWEELPGEINVREIVRLWNLATSLDLVAYAKARYNLLGQAEHWFPGENAGKLDPVAMGEALAEAPFRDRILEVLSLAHRDFAEAPKKRLSESSP
ncbi:MAG TPA: aldo/keto reductase [Kiritimatiellia bacterium]|nr:aldo/keto reductase [Kiritimatiellia bacterium]